MICPACIENAAVMIAGAASTGGILAVCIGKLRKLFTASDLGLFHKTKEKLRWQHLNLETKNTEKGLSR